jgi:hypothetical protein
MYVIENKALREIKLSKAELMIIYVKRRNYHFNTLCYSLVALLTLMIIENVMSIHNINDSYSASNYYPNVF